MQRGGDAEVVGILEVKALAGRLGRPDPDLFRELRPALFVSESTGALKLLEIHAGDAVYMPANTTGVWDVIETVRKTWILLP